MIANMEAWRSHALIPEPRRNRATMRPNVSRSYTITGRYGIYLCPTVSAVDSRSRILAGLLAGATPDTAARIRHDLDLLLDHRLALMTEREAAT